MKRMLRLPAALWKTLIGALLSQNPITSFLIVGWTYRLIQRNALKRWWRLSPMRKPNQTFREFAAGVPELNAYASYPNWMLTQRFPASLKRRIAEAQGPVAKTKALFACVFGSLGKNAKLGVQGMINIWILTLLPALLWSFGWYSGWDNSFNKGYEQYYVGIITSLTGIALFIAVMFYLPMAQARQAVTGNWRAFFQFKTVWTVVRARSLSALLLAIGYAAVSLPVMLFKTAPYFIPQGNPAFDEMTDAQLLQFLNRYYFWTGIIFFIGYTALRILAARIYATAVLDAYQRGALELEQLGEWERRMLKGLKLSETEDPESPHVIIKVAAAVTKPVWRFATATALVLVWFSFVAQIYVSEFLNYHPVRGWTNQPLVQLPWFQYVPDHLRDE